VTEHPDPLRDLGSFIREQRANARLSLRRLSELAGISNPYLSQIERGLRHPSAEILQQIAHGLRISAETLYVRAGILDERPPAGDLAVAILDAPTLSDEQKQTLLHIYRSFVAANGGDPSSRSGVVADRPSEAPGGDRGVQRESSRP
jgi:transcriptional regulator with XRE-family HTH domain